MPAGGTLNGRLRNPPGSQRRRGHLLQPIDQCLLLHPALGDLVSLVGDLGAATALTLRLATATGALLAVIDGPVPSQASAWGCGVVQQRRGRLTPLVGSGWIVETVTGVALRITGDAFFQNHTAGAEALVGLVDEALAPRPGETLLDTYAGGGLFGLTVGRGTAAVVAVESDPVAAGDLRHNAASAPMRPGGWGSPSPKLPVPRRAYRCTPGKGPPDGSAAGPRRGRDARDRLGREVTR